MKKQSGRIIWLITAIITTIILLVGATAFAAAEPSAEIKLHNLSTKQNVVIKYAVEVKNLPGGATVGVDLRREGKSSEATFSEIAEIGGKEYYIFDADDLSAAEMTVDVYARPYIERDDGTRIYGAEKKNSILEYAYKALGKIDTSTEASAEIKALLNSMLKYGAEVQRYTETNLERPADAEYYQVNVVGGTLSDGYTSGLYRSGEQITLTAPAVSGKNFKNWTNSAGASVSTSATYTFTVGSKNETYTAVYQKDDGNITYVLGGGSLPSGSWNKYTAGTAFTLPTPTRSGYVFSGWFTSSDFDGDSIITEIPATATGKYTLYAKWNREISHLDGVMIGSGSDDAKNSYGVTRGTNKTTETTDLKNAFSVENGALIWKQGNSKASQITLEGNLKTMLAGAKQFTFTVTLSKPDGADTITSNFRLRRKDENHTIILFKTESNGQVTLGSDSSVLITTLDNEPSTFSITVDFEEGTLTAYNERGVRVGVVGFAPPSSDTQYTTLDAWYNVMTAYVWQWYSNPADSTATAYQRMTVHEVSIYEGDSAFRTNGDGYTDEERAQMREDLIKDIADLRTEMNSIYGPWTVGSNATNKYLFKEYTSNITSLLSSSEKTKWGTAPTTPLDEHPRVLFTKDDIPAIKAALEDDSNSNLLFKTYLIGDVSGELPSVGEYVSGSTVNCYNYSAAVIEQILAKALAYQLYGSDYYGYQAIYAMKNYLKTLNITYCTSDQYRIYGHVMFATACVYDWCYDLLTDTDKTQFIAGVENVLCRGSNEKGVKFEQGFPPTKQGSFTGHGSEYGILRDYLSFSIAIYDENASWWNYVGARFYNDFVPSRNAYYVTGIASQGTSYVGARHTASLFSAWLVENGTKASTNPYVNMDKTVRSYIGYEFAPGLIFSDGDSSVNQKTSVLRDQCFISAMLFDDATLLAQGEYLLGSGRYAGATQGLTLVPYVILCGRLDVEAAEDRYDGLDLIQYNGSPLGQYVIRERYGDADSAAVFMKLKERHTANHEHADAGTFQIYYKGLLTGDSGVYNNYGHDHSKYFNKGTVAHNGILIYDSSQQSTLNGWYTGSQRLGLPEAQTLTAWQDSKYDTGTITGRQHAYSDAAETKPLYAYIAGDITKAYDTASQARYVGRRMLTVYTGNEDFPMVFFVYDDVESYKDSYVKKFLLQINSPDAPTVSGNTVITEKSDGRLVLTCLSDNIRIDEMGGRAYTSDGKYDPDNSRNFLINGKQCVTLDKKDDGHWGRVEIVYTATSNTATFMNVLYVTDKGQTKNAPAITRITGTGALGGAFGDVAAIFATSRDRATGSLSATVSGSGNIKYYVSGVAAGEWTITVGGVSYGTATATADGGLLTFTAPAGALKLTKK